MVNFYCCDQVNLFPWFGLHPSVRVGRVPVWKTLGVAAGEGRTPPIVWSGIPWRHQVKSRVLVMATGRRRRGFLCVRLRDLPNVDVGFAKEATRIFEHSLAWVHYVKGGYWSLHLGHVSCLVQQSLKPKYILLQIIFIILLYTCTLNTNCDIQWNLSNLTFTGRDILCETDYKGVGLDRFHCSYTLLYNFDKFCPNSTKPTILLYI